CQYFTGNASPCQADRARNRWKRWYSLNRYSPDVGSVPDTPPVRRTAGKSGVSCRPLRSPGAVPALWMNRHGSGRIGSCMRIAPFALSLLLIVVLVGIAMAQADDPDPRTDQLPDNAIWLEDLD